MDTYIVIQVKPATGQPYWTVALATTGDEVPEAPHSISKHVADEHAANMNARMAEGFDRS